MDFISSEKQASHVSVVKLLMHLFEKSRHFTFISFQYTADQTQSKSIYNFNFYVSKTALTISMKFGIWEFLGVKNRPSQVSSL